MWVDRIVKRKWTASFSSVIVKATNGPRYVVGCRRQLNKAKLRPGTRVALDMTTLTVMRYRSMQTHSKIFIVESVSVTFHEKSIHWSTTCLMKIQATCPSVKSVAWVNRSVNYVRSVAFIEDQIRDVCSWETSRSSSCHWPIQNYSNVSVLLLRRVVFSLVHQVISIDLLSFISLMFLGTGKTLLARAVASQLDCNFLKVVSSAIVDKYIGESARMIREMFAYAKDHQPCIIFMDEIDAIGELLHHWSVSFLLNRTPSV